VICWYVSTDVLRALAPSLGCGLVALLATAAYLLLGTRRRSVEPVAVPAPDAEAEGATGTEEEPARPFALGPAALLALVLTAALFVGRWGVETFGSAGAVTVSGIAGLADAHAGALAAAQLAAQGQIAVATAAWAVAAALATNTMLKVVLAFAAGGVRVGGRYAMLMVAPVLAFAVPLLVTVR
jgi:uncharacterized membrane protein (DUF4010 family)